MSVIYSCLLRWVDANLSQTSMGTQSRSHSKMCPKVSTMSPFARPFMSSKEETCLTSEGWNGRTSPTMKTIMPNYGAPTGKLCRACGRERFPRKSMHGVRRELSLQKIDRPLCKEGAERGKENLKLTVSKAGSRDLSERNGYERF